MELYEVIQKAPRSQGIRPYSTPRLREYGSVVRLTRGNVSHRYSDSGNSCFTGSQGNKTDKFCTSITNPGSNSSAPKKRR